MTCHPVYPSRLSAPVSGPHGERPIVIDHKLISQLREARELGDNSMTAIEQWDPDFSVKLSACSKESDAQELLDKWLSLRLGVLKGVQQNLYQIWRAAQQKRRDEER